MHLWRQGLGAGSHRKAGKQRLAESTEQQEVALGEEPRPGNKESGTSQGQRGAQGTEHRLLAGTKPLTSQAPASADPAGAQAQALVQKLQDFITANY